MPSAFKVKARTSRQSTTLPSSDDPVPGMLDKYWINPKRDFGLSVGFRIAHPSSNLRRSVFIASPTLSLANCWIIQFLGGQPLVVFRQSLGAT
jgi:hypothetical protein